MVEGLLKENAQLRTVEIPNNKQIPMTQISNTKQEHDLEERTSILENSK